MKKRIQALIMALVMMVTTVISMNGSYINAKAATSDGITVVFHFTNDTNTYNDYRMWLWTIGDGYEVNMIDNGTEATYTLQESASTLKIGFIVKVGDGWEAKDYADDRFVNVSNITGGQVNVYLTSGVKDFEVDTTNATTGVKLASASTTDLTNVTFVASQTLTDSELSTFKLVDTANGNVISTTIAPDSAENTYVMTAASKLDAMGSYEIQYLDGMTFMVGLPDYFASDEFESQYTYTGDDLGATWSKDSTAFRVWAPLATSVSVNLYSSGEAGANDLIKSVPMTQDVNGTWVATADGDLNGVYYTYAATVKGKAVETIDPYARTSGTNGKRGMIIDLDSTDPEGWENDTYAATSANSTDDVIYELHVKDFSYDASSGMTNKGKYLAFTETGTTNSYGDSTGVDYLKDLGVTHVHILPAYDSASYDESTDTTDSFNWGYDPQNFNIPEGSYSTDASNGAVRVSEFKQMVQSLHNNGISVVMDVVYGHVAASDSFSVNVLTPSYYSRTNSNGSGCGNDTATERVMNRKYIVDSMVYWAKEYHVDGFRIDQVGLFDVDTVNALTAALKEVNPNVLLYGEGWTMSTNVAEGTELATQGNSDLTPGFGYFNDTIRDAVKGGVFTDTEAGYVTGNKTKVMSMLESLNGEAAWADEVTQVINYNSCHDNYTLFDKLHLANPGYTEEQLIAANKMAATILYASQGVPFMQAGEEILRTKVTATGAYDNNSYASSPSENAIKWDDLHKDEYQATYQYYKGLIQFRKAHAGLRMTSYADINKYFTYTMKGGDDVNNVIAYEISGDANGEVSDGIYVILNPSTEKQTITLPEGEWTICVNAEKAGTESLGTATGTVDVDAISSMILVKGNTGSSSTDGSSSSDSATSGSAAVNESPKTGDNAMLAVVALVVLMGAAISGVVVAKKRKFN